MLKKALILANCLLLSAGLYSQCADKQTLWHNITLLRDNSKAPASIVKARLQQYEKEILQCHYEYDSTHILLLRALAVVSNREGNYLEAIGYFRQCISITRHIPNNPAVDKKLLPGFYYWIAYLYQSVNNVAERLKALDSCYITGGQLNVIDRSLLCALYEKAEYYFDLGDYHHCISYAELCERKAWEYAPIAAEPDKSVAMAYGLSSFVWRVNSNIRLQQYEQAGNLMNSQLTKAGVSGLTVYKGTIYGLRAEMELHKGNYSKSVSLFNQAIAFEYKAGYGLGYRQLLNTLAYEVYFRHFRDSHKALKLLQQALRYINTDAAVKEVNVMESLNICSNMAEVYVQQGNYEKADQCFRMALDCIRPGIRLSEVVSRPPEEFIRQKKIHFLTGLVIAQGDAWLSRYRHSKKQSDLQQAIATYKMADQLVGRIREEQSSIHSKLFWRSNSHALYEHALDACLASGNMADAFYFFEKSRAVLLNDQLAEQRWLGEKEIFLQTQVRTKINNLQREKESNNITDTKLAILDAELLENQRKLDSLSGIIKARNPFYYQNFVEQDFVQLQQVQQSILKDYNALVELFCGDSAVYVMTITASNARLHRIDKQAYDSLSGQFATYLADLDLQNANWEDFIDVSTNLYKLIFQREGLPSGRVIISPDGRYFPFEALAIKTTPVTWFLEQHAISYTYSARYLLNDFTTTGAAPTKSFMGVAPVHYGYVRLPELHESDQSLNALTGYFDGATNFIGETASRKNFLRQFGDYRIIQLYTHAADNKEKGEPVIWFADSLLYLSDLISDKRPATRLVVLSACETGTGKFYQGEGVFSFNRGFAALGIPAAITSLWSADNKKTYELTRLFYKYLSIGDPADVALQRAKLEFIRNGPRQNTMPWAWAVPVLTGKVTPMVQSPHARSAWFTIKGGTMAATGLVVVFMVWPLYRCFRAGKQGRVESVDANGSGTDGRRLL